MSSSSQTIARLTEERKQWRKDHPPGFWAKPKTNEDGSLNLMEWNCGIPGPENSPWEGGVYELSLIFTPSYPTTAPKSKFITVPPHPNIYTNGAICFSLLWSWKPSMTLKQLLIGLQALLAEPNPHKGYYINEADRLYVENRPQYDKNAKAFAAKHKPKYED